MQPGIEFESTRAAALALGERFWGWEIPAYLFLGGLVAGVMVAASAAALLRGPERVTEAMRFGLLAAPVLLSIGMLALFADLTFRSHVLRFYTALRPSAPMSLGSWVLLLVFPLQALLALALPWRRARPWLDRVRVLGRVRALAERRLRGLAWLALAGGVALGLYTGILLSATVARPLWSSAALGMLFLVSGGSTGVAALLALERDAETRDLLSAADIALVAIELGVIVLWMLGLLTQGPEQREAASLVLWGPYAPAFLGLVVFGGLLVPGALELLALRGLAVHSAAVPALVLAGGFALRVVVVYAGQTGGYVAG
jgi:formate-dependent nitrite reductase membrane component NrfD